MAGKRVSAGLIMFRKVNDETEIFLAHPGGPYFHKKDDGHWSIPKGEPEIEEELLVTAIREFKEETGITPIGDFISLGSIVQKGGKEVHAWAFESDLPPNYVHECNIYEEEWPPHSGEFKEFPEVDKVGFFSIAEAKQKIKGAQIPLIDRLLKIINSEDQ